MDVLQHLVAFHLNPKSEIEKYRNREERGWEEMRTGLAITLGQALCSATVLFASIHWRAQNLLPAQQEHTGMSEYDVFGDIYSHSLLRQVSCSSGPRHIAMVQWAAHAHWAVVAPYGHMLGAGTQLHLQW